MGSHFHAFQNLLIRMPIRKTTKALSISAVTRLSMTCAMAMLFHRPTSITQLGSPRLTLLAFVSRTSLPGRTLRFPS